MNAFHKTVLAVIKITVLAAVCLFAALPRAYADCIEGDCVNGRGTFTGPNGYKYEGEFKDGKSHGHGTLTWTDGNRYAGQFKDGKRSGQGTLTWADGSRYVGGFKDDKLDGQGITTAADGNRYVGGFKDGKHHGQGVWTWADGGKHAGGFKDGKHDGRGTITWPDGVVYEGNFVDDAPQPPYDFLFPDGTRRSGTIAMKVKILGTTGNSQAITIGLQKGDIVLEYNKDVILNTAMLLHLVSQTKPGDNVGMAVERDGRELNLSLKGGRIGIFLADYPVYAVAEEEAVKSAAAAAIGRTEETGGGGEAAVSKPGTLSGAAFGRYHALVIGNNNYAALPKLKTARSDAQAVANILKNYYGFSVTLLLDAKRSDILSRLAKFREKLSDGDSLLIYYAGHGFLDKEGDEGYWLPVDATKGDETNWISNSSITTQLKAMEARHVLIVADSCYSGKLGRSVHIQKRSPDYYSRVAQRRARSVIASGGLEPVIDSGGKGNHSVFTSAFIDALKENKGIVDTAEIFNKIRQPVILNADQTPEYADIRKAGHDGGEFIFVRKK